MLVKQGASHTFYRNSLVAVCGCSGRFSCLVSVSLFFYGALRIISHGSDVLLVTAFDVYVFNFNALPKIGVTLF